MNNIEKNLKEIYDLLFYPEGLNELLSFLNEKLENITKGGIKEGLKFDEETERELIHRIMLEGVPYFISDKLRKKLTQFEGSISEQPMLLAHPSGIKEEKMLNFISKENMSELVDNDYTCVPNKLYDAINYYELYNQFRYLYLEGHYEDTSTKLNAIRTDYMLNYHGEYFKKSKFNQINEISWLIRYLPYELNKKFPLFSLQINDYIQASYFRENFSYVGRNFDSSFDKDTGKKLTCMIILFPEDLEIERRQLKIILDKEIIVTQPLSAIILKSRRQSYEIPKHDFPFIILFYYIHGPIDKDSLSC